MANLFESLKNLLAAAATNPIENLQAAVERIILYSRYFLVVICIGLAFALGIYAIAFIFEVVHVAELAPSHANQWRVQPGDAHPRTH